MLATELDGAPSVSMHAPVPEPPWVSFALGLVCAVPLRIHSQTFAALRFLSSRDGPCMIAIVSHSRAPVKWECGQGGLSYFFQESCQRIKDHFPLRTIQSVFVHRGQYSLEFRIIFFFLSGSSVS